MEEGHLAEALEWIEALELDCRIPVDPERPEAPAAEELLERWGNRGYRLANLEAGLIGAGASALAAAAGHALARPESETIKSANCLRAASLANVVRPPPAPTSSMRILAILLVIQPAR